MKSLAGVLVGGLVLLVTGLTEAHPGLAYAGGLAAGFIHPLTGIDHLLAMVLVGLWAAQLGGRALWVVPLSFVLLMAIGDGAAMAGIQLPLVELVIALSVAALGALIAGRVQAPTALAALIVAAFGVMHGHAHGAELPPAATAASYALGFVSATVLLHLAGIVVGMAARSTSLIRYAGGAVALVGLTLIG